MGTAGWSIPRDQAPAFPADGSGLVRYSHVLACAEINSSFYRSHRVSTYMRWAASVPEDFRFSVKAPRAITHECALKPTSAQIRSFLDELSPLGSKLGAVLLQLPPRQQFDLATAQSFLGLVREVYSTGALVVEPRHESWFGGEADALLKTVRVARVIADPARAAEARHAAGDRATRYYRLHGSPRTYYSSYATEFLERIAEELVQQQPNTEAWCIFDNTASGAAMANVLELKRLLAAMSSAPQRHSTG